MLPKKSWSSYEARLQEIGERRFHGSSSEIALLVALGLASEGPLELTPLGEQYFSSRFIRAEPDSVREILAAAVRTYPPAEAIVQLLAGVAEVDRTRVETVLRSQGLDDGLAERSLSSLLVLLDEAGVIRYTRNSGAVEVLASPAKESAPPRNVFVSPSTPFGNRVWLRRVIESLEGFVFWFDKHFLPAAFEVLWEAADGSRIREVRVLSLEFDANQGRTAKRQYRDLRTELATRGVSLEWRTIDSKEVRDTHDRWLIGEGAAWNVPNVNAILSGQNSELSESSNHEELRGLFEDYWGRATPMDG